MENKNQFDVAVAGGGPAGIMAAFWAAKAGAKVVLLEKNSELSKKLLLTGNGRCNITNAEFDLKKLVQNYSQNGKFLFHAFSVFGPREAIEFFESCGIKTKIENNNRVFPAHGKAKEVQQALKQRLLESGVYIKYNAEVLKIVSQKNKIQKLILADKSEILAKNYVFSTGGKSYPETGSDGHGYEMIKNLGHSINKLRPSLVPIKIKESWAIDLQGMALKNIKISVLPGKKISETGDIVFTHFGLSGPAVLNLSQKISDLKGELKLSIDLFPFLNHEQLKEKIYFEFKKYPNKYLKKYLAGIMPQRLAPVFGQLFNLDFNKQVGNLSVGQKIILVNALKNIILTACGLLGFDLAMATSGGVAVEEIDHKTMKSKIIENLFFAGEIIDVDAKTGGFNLQKCWSTGRLAGKNAAILQDI